MHFVLRFVDTLQILYCGTIFRETVLTIESLASLPHIGVAIIKLQRRSLWLKKHWLVWPVYYSWELEHSG
jgi:hypothetical protein